MDADFAVLVDVDVHHDAVVGRDVFTLHKFHLCILVALLVEILRDAVFRAVNEVLRHLVSDFQRYARLDVFALALLHTIDFER